MNNEGWTEYSFTSIAHNLTDLMDTTFSSYITRCVGNLTWDNLVTELTVEPSSSFTTVNITSGSIDYPDHTMSGHTLVDSGGNFAMVLDNQDTTLTLATSIAGMSMPVRLEEGQIIWSGTFQGNNTEPYWFNIYDTFSKLYGSGTTDLRNTEINLISSGYGGPGTPGNPNRFIGRVLQSRIYILLPPGAQGNKLRETETIQGTTVRGIEVNIYDKNNNLYKVVSSNNNGRWSATVPPGRYTVRYVGHNIHRDSDQETFSTSHGLYSSKFGKDTFKTFSQYKDSIALSQIGANDFGQFVLYENFVTESGRTSDPEPQLSGQLLEGHWGSGHTYCDWYWISSDPTILNTTDMNTSYYTRPYAGGAVEPDGPEV